MKCWKKELNFLLDQFISHRGGRLPLLNLSLELARCLNKQLTREAAGGATIKTFMRQHTVSYRCFGGKWISEPGLVLVEMITPQLICH